MKSNETNQRKLVKLKAKDLILSNGNYLIFLLAIIVSLTFAVIPIFIFAILYSFADQTLSIIGLIAIEFLIVLPVFIGLYRIFALAAEMEDFCFMDLFFAFSSFGRYAKSLLMAIVEALIFTTPFSLGVIVCSIMVQILKNTGMTQSAFLTVSGVAGALIVILFIPLMYRFYGFMQFYVTEKYSFKQSISMSFKATKKKSNFLLSFDLSFLPLIIVSVLLVCMPFVMFTLPYLICSKAILSVNLRKESDKSYYINDKNKDADKETIDLCVTEETNE